jgi:hypothetical protein
MFIFIKFFDGLRVFTSDFPSSPIYTSTGAMNPRSAMLLSAECELRRFALQGTYSDVNLPHVTVLDNNCVLLQGEEMLLLLQSTTHINHFFHRTSVHMWCLWRWGF